MRGVALDAHNPAGRPSVAKLKYLGVTGYRMELRDTPEFLSYYATLRPLNSAILIGPSTESYDVKLPHEPDIVIIGNEPDSDGGDSSWSMPPAQYITMYNAVAPHFPDSAISVAGMLRGTEYLRLVLPELRPKPTYVNCHYPNTELDVTEFRRLGPTIIGEWAWATGTEEEVVDWQTMLRKHTAHSFWFCWSNGMVPDMGLVSESQQRLPSYYNYQAALRV